MAACPVFAPRVHPRKFSSPTRRRRARRQPHASPFSHVSILEEDAVRRRTERAGQMPPRSRVNAERINGASPPAPKHVPSPIFLPLPPHPVDRWSREDARAEPVEQLLYGPVQTRRPTLVHAPLGAEAEAALGAEAGSLLLGDGTDMAAAYKAVAYGLRDGWDSCPPQVSSRLSAHLPRWLAPRVAGDLLCRVPTLAATQHVRPVTRAAALRSCQAAALGRPGSSADHPPLEAPSKPPALWSRPAANPDPNPNPDPTLTLTLALTLTLTLTTQAAQTHAVAAFFLAPSEAGI